MSQHIPSYQVLFLSFPSVHPYCDLSPSLLSYTGHCAPAAPSAWNTLTQSTVLTPCQSSLNSNVTSSERPSPTIRSSVSTCFLYSLITIKKKKIILLMHLLLVY